MKKKAIIAGVSGQDGSYLAKYLIKKNYKVIGILKKKNFRNLNYLGIKNNIRYLYCNLSNFKKISLYIKKIQPYLFFNLGGISNVEDSFKNPLYNDKINNSAVLNILESIKRYSNKTRFFQASSSELFDEKNKIKVNEDSRLNPKSPYSIAKLSAYYYTKFYRNHYNIFAVNGILFNHESPLRKKKFVTKKIIEGLINYKLKKKRKKIIKLGNIYLTRDWGNAENYVKAIYKTLKINKAYDFIICTGIKRSVKDFINLVSKQLKINIKWIKKKNKEMAFDIKTKKIIIETKKNITKNNFSYNFIGDNSRAIRLLKWKVDKDINKLIQKMINFQVKEKKNFRNC